jgi:hypothetical protein
MPQWMRTRTLRTVGLLFGLSMMLSACGRIGDLLDLIGGGGPDPGDVSCESEPGDVSSESEPGDVSSESEPGDVSSESEPGDVSSESEPGDVSSESEPDCESEDAGSGGSQGVPDIQQAVDQNL